MRPLATLLVPVAAPDREPTSAELDLIEQEMPVIQADVELLDARIATFDRTPSELDVRRIRRAQRRLLIERARLANRTRMAMAEVWA